MSVTVRGNVAERIGPVLALATLFATTACGEPAPTTGPAGQAIAVTAVAPTSTTSTTPASVPRPTVATITAIDEAATVATPADRLDDDLVVAWIGGSDLELEDRLLPTAVARRLPEIDGRSVVIDADTVIGPLPRDIAGSVQRAADRNVDALVVSMPPSWTAWDGHDECEGITPPHDFYRCILDPRAGTDVAELQADIATLIETVRRTDIPAYLYVLPHSNDALANAPLAARLVASEAIFATLDPKSERIEYSASIVTRNLSDLREGTEFFDMVHPTVTGVERLAPFFADEIARFLTEQTTN